MLYGLCRVYLPPLFAAAAMTLPATTAQADDAHGGCQQELISVLMSPDDAWIAMVQEEICSGFGIATSGTTDVVQLVRRGEKPNDNNNVFAIEELGHSEIVQLPDGFRRKDCRSRFQTYP